MYPDRFLIARSLAPELVGAEDIVELDLDGQPVPTFSGLPAAQRAGTDARKAAGR